MNHVVLGNGHLSKSDVYNPSCAQHKGDDDNSQRPHPQLHYNHLIGKTQQK